MINWNLYFTKKQQSNSLGNNVLSKIYEMRQTLLINNINNIIYKISPKQNTHTWQGVYQDIPILNYHDSDGFPA